MLGRVKKQIDADISTDRVRVIGVAQGVLRRLFDSIQCREQVQGNSAERFFVLEPDDRSVDLCSPAFGVVVKPKSIRRLCVKQHELRRDMPLAEQALSEALAAEKQAEQRRDRD